MSPGEEGALDGLRRQARRLRFEDAALETAFHDERVAAAKVRTQVLLPIGILAVALIGYCEATVGSEKSPEMLRRTLETRFFGMILPWLIIYVSTFLPGYRRWTDWLSALGTVAVCWALARRYWHFALIYPETQIVGTATGALLSVLLVSTISLTMSFRALAVTTLASFGGTLLVYWMTLPADRGGELFVMAMTFAAVGLLMLFLGWYREAADRLMFAQREYVRTLNAELARLNAEKNEFIAIASHDLRSPLATVLGLADRLVEGGGPCGGEARAPGDSGSCARHVASGRELSRGSRHRTRRGAGAGGANGSRGGGEGGRGAPSAGGGAQGPASPARSGALGVGARRRGPGGAGVGQLFEQRAEVQPGRGERGGRDRGGGGRWPRADRGVGRGAGNRGGRPGRRVSQVPPGEPGADGR